MCCSVSRGHCKSIKFLLQEVPSTPTSSIPGARLPAGSAGKSTQASLGRQLTQSATQRCTVTGLSSFSHTSPVKKTKKAFLLLQCATWKSTAAQHDSWHAGAGPERAGRKSHRLGAGAQAGDAGAAVGGGVWAALPLTLTSQNARLHLWKSACWRSECTGLTIFVFGGYDPSSRCILTSLQCIHFLIIQHAMQWRKGLERTKCF